MLRSWTDGEKAVEVQIDRMKQDLEVVNSFTAPHGPGITRFTFSKEYMGALSYLKKELAKIGAEVSFCRAGNLRGRLAGREEGKPAVMVGSHIDTVLEGGRFDGLVGVVAALEAARVISEQKVPHQHPIDVVIFTEEEGSRFGSVLTGSRAWVGKLSLENLRQLKDSDGMNYLDALEQTGILIEDDSVLQAEQVKAMLELHIEQSVVLERKGLQIGAVETIAGIKQFWVTIEGVANHAGATPMNYRMDALQGAARIISSVEEIAKEARSRDTVATVGFVHCTPGQANVIPGKVQFTLDIRDPEPPALNDTVREIKAVIEKICTDRALHYEIKPRSDTPPVHLSEKMVALIERVAKTRNIPFLKMISGAVHDSSVLAELTEVGMIFVPSHEGRSHCPEENTEWRDIQAGADILLASVAELAA
jgi:allantoate deiminase